MGERRAGRFTLGRRKATADAAEPEVPCVPCAQQAALRPFALNQRTADRIDDDFVASLDPAVAYSIVDGEVVLFDERRQTSSLLNSTAALIWASVDGTTSLGQIADELALETGGDRDVIASDVRDTFARFIDGSVLLDTVADRDAPPPAVADQSADELDALDAQRAGGERRRHRIERVLARRSWALDDVRRCAGATVTIRTDSAEVAAVLAPALALLPRPDATDVPIETVTILVGRRDPFRRFRVMRGTETVRFATSVEDAIDGAFTDLNELAIRETPDRLVLHAGAVERGGEVVVVAGASGWGKTTLTAALVRAGWGYLTDEVVAIDPTTHQVLPYPKPFDLDEGSCELLDIEPVATTATKAKVPVGRVGTVGRPGGRVALVVLLDDPNRSTPKPETTAQLLVEVLGNTFASTFEHLGGAQPALDAMTTLASSVRLLLLERQSLDDAARAVADRLESTRSTGAPAGGPPQPVAP